MVETRLKENFCCAKCRSKVCYVRIRTLPAGNLVELIRQGEITAKYYVVTCGLCGYTEFYDARVCAAQPETAAEPGVVQES